MTTLRDLRFTILEYRPDPARADGSIPLGVFLEVRRRGFWTFAMSCRQAMQQAELEQMDLLARQTLEKPFEHFWGRLNELVKEIASQRLKPDDLFDRFLREHSWSIHACPPKPLEIRVVSGTARKSVDRELNALYLKKVAKLSDAEVPPPWMLPKTGILSPLGTKL